MVKIEEVQKLNFKGTFVTFIQGILLIVGKSTLISIVDMNKVVDIDIEKVLKQYGQIVGEI